MHFEVSQSCPMGFLGGAADKESPCNSGGTGSSPGWRRALEEGMATPCSILAWRIPRTEEPAGLQSVGSKNRTCRQRQDVQQGRSTGMRLDEIIVLI